LGREKSGRNSRAGQEKSAAEIVELETGKRAAEIMELSREKSSRNSEARQGKEQQK